MRVLLSSILLSLAVTLTVCFLMMPESSEAERVDASQPRDLTALRALVARLQEELSQIEARVTMNEMAPMSSEVVGDGLQTQRSEDEDDAGMTAFEAHCESELETIRQRLDDLTQRIEAIEGVATNQTLNSLKKTLVGENNGKPSWGVEQALGPPDTPTPGDHSTAWASSTPDDQDEWLIMTFANPIRATAVEIHETYNPGAVDQISAIHASGEEQVLWSGDDPSANSQQSQRSERSEQSGVSVIPIACDQKIYQIRVHVASTRVSGWNEIDAVALVDRKRNRYWAVAAEGSSTYAQRSSMLTNSGEIQFDGKK